jgi:diaminohydroxyphosphoribosylaminopyrimidine deaminase/5-amino-6-(5-phosphoribosylamino)uracil reductase
VSCKLQAASYKLQATSYKEEGRVLISNEYTNRLVHKWRSEEAAILVGTNTALLDDPALTVRLWKGPDPIRLVIDKDLSLPASLRLFDGQVRTIVFNLLKHGEQGNLQYYQLAGDSSLVHQLVVALHQLKIQSVLVEGGAALLQSFIDEGYWDEARIITNETLQIPGGLPSPVLQGGRLVSQEKLFSDVISHYNKT